MREFTQGIAYYSGMDFMVFLLSIKTQKNRVVPSQYYPFPILLYFLR